MTKGISSRGKYTHNVSKTMAECSYQLLTSSSISIPVKTGLSLFHIGPSSSFLYTILQGFFTVLAIKEVVSVTRYFVKSSSTTLRINRIILWNMVENWEDLFKIFKQLLFPRRMTIVYNSKYPHRRPLTALGWKRYVVSAIIAFWLFSADIVLIITSVPSRSDQGLETVSSIRWDNQGRIPNLAKDNVLIRGSFSKGVQLSSIADNVEFTNGPSVSLERTNFKDFRDTLPPYEGKLFTCNATERWRLICQVYCEKRFYQFKLRLDVNVEDGESSYFVPTSNMSVVGGKNRIQHYADEISKQLGISGLQTNSMANGSYFEILSNKLVKERTRINGKDELTHDAIATIFLGSICIRVGEKNASYYERKFGERKETFGKAQGKVGVSQRPILPLIGTISVYVVMQVVSIVLQTSLRWHLNTPEVKALVEIGGGDVMENMANLDARDLEEKYSRVQFEASITKDRQVGHVGYLPCDMVLRVRDWVSHKLDDDEKSKQFGLITTEDEIRSLDQLA